MRLDSSGNLGIGTSSPARKLQVNSGEAVAARFTRSGGIVANNSLEWFDGTNAWYAGVSGSNFWGVGYNTSGAIDSAAIRLDSSGNLGLGVTPAATYSRNLQIDGSSSAGIRLTSTSYTAGFDVVVSAGDAYLLNRNNTALIFGTNASERARISSDGTFRVKGAGTAGSTDAVQFSGSAPASTLILDSSGNLGIGTSSPGVKLDVSSTGAGIRLKQLSAGSATYYQMDNTVETGGKVWRFGYTGASGIPTFSLYNQTDNVTSWIADSSGNLGLGVTPSAWSSFKGLQVGDVGAFASADFGGSNVQAFLGNNAYYGSGGFNYIKTNVAAMYRMVGGAHQWSTAASGTANTVISFTQAMTLDASGNLAIRAVSNNATTAFNIQEDSGVNLAVFSVNEATGEIRIGGVVNNYFPTFYSSNTERARISSDGTFRVKGVGTAGSTDAFQVSGSAPADAARITSGGNLLVGTTTDSAGKMTVTAAAAQNAINIVVPTVDYYGAVLHNQATSGDNVFIAFGTEASFTTRGSITYNRAGGLVAYNTTSDYRAKDILGPVASPGATIDALKVYEGQMKGATQSRPMLVAHEAQAVAPYSVTGEKDAVNDNGDPVFQQMDVSSLVPLLIAEIQSLRARLAAAGI
jgi:hypothetical protein